MTKTRNRFNNSEEDEEQPEWIDEYEEADRREKSKMEMALLLESGFRFDDIFKTTYAEQQALIEGRNALEEERKSEIDKPKSPKHP